MDATYSPALRKLTPVEDAIAMAQSRWPASPANSLEAHKLSLETIFATLPVESRKSIQGKRWTRYFIVLEQAIEQLDAETERKAAREAFANAPWKSSL